MTRPLASLSQAAKSRAAGTSASAPALRMERGMGKPPGAWCFGIERARTVLAAGLRAVRREGSRRRARPPCHRQENEGGPHDQEVAPIEDDLRHRGRGAVSGQPAQDLPK